MKKLIVVSLALAAATTMYAQGTVKFSTTGGRVSFATVAEGETAYKVGDFIGSDFIGVVKLDGKEVGRAKFADASGKPTGRMSGDTLAIEGLAEGGTFTFTLEAFNAAYEAADKSLLIPGGKDGLYFGKSGTFDYKAGEPSNPLALPPVAMNVANFGVNAYSVPEPTTIALGILGLSSLLLFRRRD